MKKKIVTLAFTLCIFALNSTNVFGQKNKELEFPAEWKGFNGTLLVVDEYDKGPYHDQLTDLFTSVYTAKVKFISQIDTVLYKPKDYPYLVKRDFKASGQFGGVAGSSSSYTSWHFCLVETNNLTGVCTKSYNQNKWDKGLKFFVEQLENARK
ncbi:MAG: hypothetical protein ABIR78_03250 [Ferruginibacter sp.]